jgi:hypothetical protein
VRLGNKRALSALIAVGLITGVVAGGSADAAKKKKKKAKPVKTTLYFHGGSPIGESESMGAVADVPLPMSPEKPSGAEPKSKQIVNGVVTPNSQCANNNLFPNWRGEVAGTIKGDVKVTFNAVSSPGSVVVRVWPDVASLLCTSTASGTADYPKPAGETVIALPNGPGEVTAVLKNVKTKAIGSLLVQISPAEMETPARKIFPPSFARLLYDTTDFDSRIEFTCIPAKGKSCTP